MEPRATSYTKLVSCLDDRMLNMIKVVRFFLVGVLVPVTGFGAFGLGLAAI